MDEYKTELMKKLAGGKERFVDSLVRMAAQRVCEGVIEEPRLFFSTITLDAAGLVTRQPNDNIYRNGEKFPVRITHAIAAMRVDFANAATDDDRLLQDVGLRFTMHDQYYQSRDLLPLPLWSNKIVAGPRLTSRATSAWMFDRPFVLSARDSMVVKLQVTPPAPDEDSGKLCSVGFTGTGLLSNQPYFWGSSLAVEDGTVHTLPTGDFRNDGAEPIAITDMTAHCGAASSANDANGDIRRLDIQVQQNGNGTNTEWLQGDAARCPAIMLGLHTGRAMVHRFPGDGLQWEPGEGLTVEAQALTPAKTGGKDVTIALVGYVAVI